MAAIIFWSLNLIIANYFATELMPFEFAFGRWLTASIIMLPFAIKTFKRQGDILRQHWKLVAAMALVGVVMIVPFMLLTVPATRLENINSEDIGVMIYLGIFNSTFAYLCWNSALARLGNIKTAIIYYLLPIISGLEAYLFLGQKLFAAEIIGGLLIIVGITLVNLNKKAQS